MRATISGVPTRLVSEAACTERVQRPNYHGHQKLTCTGRHPPYLYLIRPHGLWERSHVSVKRPHGLWEHYLISLQPRLRHGFKVGVRLHTPRPVGMQVNNLGVNVNNLNLGVRVNNLGVGPSAIPSTISCTHTSSTNTARSS